MIRPRSDVSLRKRMMIASGASSMSYDGGSSPVASLMKSLSCLFTSLTYFSSWFSARRESFSSRRACRSASDSSSSCPVMSLGLAIRSVAGIDEWRMAFRIGSGLNSSGIFPPVHAVPVDVDEWFLDHVMISVFIHRFPAHRDVPVIDDAEAARLKQRVERPYGVHC